MAIYYWYIAINFFTDEVWLIEKQKIFPHSICCADRRIDF